MFRSLLATSSVALFAAAGCEDSFLFHEPAGETQVVYLNGQPDHCIVVPTIGAQPLPSQSGPQTNYQPAIAEGR
jgi:hypothetical protein